MKWIVVGLLLGAVGGCGTSDEATAASRPKRTMVSGSLVLGTAVNLVSDPGFALVSTPGSYGGFYGSAGSTFTPLTIVTARDSRSPAGLRGAVALLTAPGATDAAGVGISFLGTVTGGTGPFHAEVWVSKSTLAGAPTTFDASEVHASVLYQQGGALDLDAVVADIRMVGARKWLPLRADFADGFAQGGYLSIAIPTSGGTWQVAAPSLVAQPLVDGVPTRALPWTATRPQTAAEEKTIIDLRARRPL